MKLILSTKELLVMLRNGVDIELNGSGAYYPSGIEKYYYDPDSYLIEFTAYTPQEIAESYTITADPPPEPVDNLFEDVKPRIVETHNPKEMF